LSRDRRIYGRPASDQKIVLFNAHYDTYYSLIFSIVLSKVGNYHDAEDICQEVFVIMYRKIDEIEKPRSWLLGCLRNVVYEYYREKRHKDIDVDALFDDISMGYVNGFRDTRITISQILEEIRNEESDEDATLFDLVALYNFSFAQAHLHLNITYKQAVYRYNRISAKVKAKLNNRGIANIEDLL